MSPVCENEWEVVSGMGSLGGEFQSTSSVEECLNLCLAHIQCAAADVSTVPPALCFLHSNSSLSQQAYYNNSIMTQYRILNRCPASK